MTGRNKSAYVWLLNRLKRKYKIPTSQAEAVLGAIGDLAWDWDGSRYDLWGIQIEEILGDLGKKRCPRMKRKDLFL